MARLRHNNPSQLVKEPGFNPLLRDEPPNIVALNRPSKSAYQYAELVNRTLSYGGSISSLRPSNDILSYNFKLYELVEVIDGEAIRPADKDSAAHSRYGIVLAELDEDGYYILSTFCPNLVFPEDHNFTLLNATSGFPQDLYIDNTAPFGLTEIRPTVVGQDKSIGYFPLAKVTGKRSIYFNGILRSVLN